MSYTKKRVLWASIIGNSLEFYDFSLYGILVTTLAKEFFSQANPKIGLLATLTVFAVGFLMRPLGAILFGYIGDQYGRKKALTLSIMMMAFPTMMIGFLPSYETIGFIAPILLILCRLLQGLCAGGEYNGSTLFLLEHSSSSEKGFAGCLASVSGAGGSLIAMIIGSLVMNTSMPNWGWRLPFILGGILGIIGLYIRLKLEETPEFLSFSEKPNVRKNSPLKIVFSTHKKALVKCILGAGFCGMLATTFVAYSNLYLQKIVGFSIYSSLILNSFGLGMFISCCLMVGWLSKFMKNIVLMRIGSFGILAVAYPVYMLFQTGRIEAVFLAEALLAFFASFFIASFNTFMSYLFPIPIRYTGSALGYNLGMALFGGTLPFFNTWLIEQYQNINIPAYYLSALATVSLFITLHPSEENKI